MRFQAVAFHFSNVGNDEGAMSFLKDLDDHDVVGKYVDCLDGMSAIGFYACLLGSCY